MLYYPRLLGHGAHSAKCSSARHPSRKHTRSLHQHHSFCKISHPQASTQYHLLKNLKNPYSLKSVSVHSACKKAEEKAHKEAGDKAERQPAEQHTKLKADLARVDEQIADSIPQTATEGGKKGGTGKGKKSNKRKHEEHSDIDEGTATEKVRVCLPFSLS